MSRVCMLTTKDNPFNPFEYYDDWLRYDEEKGYYSNSKLARILQKNNISIFGDLTQKEIDEATEAAIDEFVKYDFLDLFKKATKEYNTTTKEGKKV